VDFFGVELFCQRGEVGYICKEHCYQFPLPLDGAPGSERILSAKNLGV
jgi:hypothetical protein